MHDFAKTTKQRSRVINSPFSAFLKQQRWLSVRLMFRKIFISLLLIGICLSFSIAILSFTLLHASAWKGDTPIGITVLTSQKGQILKDTSIIWIDPDQKTTTLLSIPGNLSVHTQQPGAYTLTALYGLYALDHAPANDFLKTLTRNLRIYSPYLVVGDGRKAPTVALLRSVLLTTLFDTSSTATFSFPERFAVFWYALFGGSRSVGLPFPQSVSLSDQGLDDINYDRFVEKNFSNTLVKKEGFSISIVNASQQRKLASTVGRVFSVLGFNVLSVSDTPNQLDQGSIVVSEGKIMNSATLQMLTKYISGKITVSSEIASEYRSDIVVYLGKPESLEFTP